MIARLLATIGAAVCLLMTAFAAAQPSPRVVLLEPDAPDALGVEVFARLRGELSAAGFEVMVMPVSADAEPRAALEDAGKNLGPAAVVILQRSVDANTGEEIAELWISDLLLQRTLIQRARVNPEKPSRDIARLAVQVAELLKARLAELSVHGERKPAAPEPPKPPPAPPPPTPEPQPVPEPTHAVVSTFALGVGLLQGFEQGSPTWTPLARFGVAFPRVLAPALTLELRASAAAFGQIAEYSAEDGSASWRQSFGTVEILARFFQRSPIQPLLSLSSGVYVLEVAGQASTPYRARGDTTWSALSAVGTGLWFPVGDSFAWVLDGHVMAVWSATDVRVNGREVWSTGTPIVFAGMSFGGLL